MAIDSPNKPGEPRSPEPPLDPQRRQELNRTTSRQFIISVSIGVLVILALGAVAYSRLAGL